MAKSAPIELRLGRDVLDVLREPGETPAELGRLQLLREGRVLGVGGGEVLHDLQPGARVPYRQLQLGAALQQQAVAGSAGGDLLDRRELGRQVVARPRHLARGLQGDGLRRSPSLQQGELLLGVVELGSAERLVEPVIDDLHRPRVELAGALQGERAARRDRPVRRVGEGDVPQALRGAAHQQLARGVGGERVADRQQARHHMGILAGGEVHLGGEDLGRQEVRGSPPASPQRPGPLPRCRRRRPGLRQALSSAFASSILPE